MKVKHTAWNYKHCFQVYTSILLEKGHAHFYLYIFILGFYQSFTLFKGFLKKKKKSLFVSYYMLFGPVVEPLCAEGGNISSQLFNAHQPQNQLFSD